MRTELPTFISLTLPAFTEGGADPALPPRHQEQYPSASSRWRYSSTGPVSPHRNTSSWSVRFITGELRDSEDSDSAPPRPRASSHHRTLCSRSSFTDERGDDGGGAEVWSSSREEERGSKMGEIKKRRSNRSDSLRLDDSRGPARTWSCQDNPDRRVHFQRDASPPHRQHGSSQVWEMLGQVLMERGVPVRFGHGAPLKILPQDRDGTRRTFHGDVRQRRRLSCRDHRESPRHGDREKRGEQEGDAEVQRTAGGWSSEEPRRSFSSRSRLTSGKADPPTSPEGIFLSAPLV